jgi:hypothetical protein
LKGRERGGKRKGKGEKDEPIGIGKKGRKMSETLVSGNARAVSATHPYTAPVSNSSTSTRQTRERKTHPKLREKGEWRA